MNPLTDLSTKLLRADGTTVEIIQPGARLIASKNWRLTEEAYRRYASHIQEALANFPKETKFDIPAGMSPNTFVHRLRDALQAIVLYPYDVEVHEKVKTLRAELMVSMDTAGTGVWIREKGRPGRPVKMLLGQSNDRPGYINANVLPNPTIDVLRAYCTLGASGHRTDPVQFKGIVPADVQAQLMSQFDTAFAYDETADITTMI